MAPLPPATLEGWYALHQMFTVDWAAVSALQVEQREKLASSAQTLFREIGEPQGEGWSAAFRLVGGGSDLMLMHLRASLDELSEVEARVRRSAVGAFLDVSYDYLSVTEAGLYQATAEAASEHKPGSAEFNASIEEQIAAERASPYLKTRLYPTMPESMRYVSFYPMTKRRNVEQNWYTLAVGERNRLMREHGMTGRRYAGRVFQVITGSIGLDDWEWGVTLFTADPLEFKRIVSEMRYDEASSVYGEFGSFFTGIRMDAADAAAYLVEVEAST